MSNIRIVCALLVTAAPLASCSADHGTQPDLGPQFITGGFIDENDTYANVGAFIVKNAETGRITPICSGTLIGELVFLTAAHCTASFEQELAPLGYTAFVSFDNPIPYGMLTTNRTRLFAADDIITNPAYSFRQSDSGDIGVIILARSPSGVTPAALPEEGVLDELAAQNQLANATFTAVGYGVQDRVVGGGTPFFQDVNPIPRMYSFPTFMSLGQAYLRLSQNAATGNGGTCFGDSGGPNFLEIDGVMTLAATTVRGDLVCRATNVTYRLDTTSARRFLSAFVPLP